MIMETADNEMAFMKSQKRKEILFGYRKSPFSSRVLNLLQKIERSFNIRYKVILEMILEMLVSNQSTRK